MKISLLISAIIVGLAAYFGLDQKEKIQRLTTEWEELKTTAIANDISTDPKAAFSSQRARSDGARAAREKAISDFAIELSAFAQKMEAAEADGTADQPALQKEAMGFLGTLGNMSPSDYKSLIKALSQDTSIADKTKRDLVMMSVMMISSENPEAALSLIAESAESIGLGENGSFLLPMVISQFAEKDPQGAADWLAENEDTLGDEAEQMKMMLITTAAKKDFQTGPSIASSLGIDDKNKVYNILATSVTAESKDEFMTALKDKDVSETQRQAALTSLVNSPFITGDFEAATTWLEGPEVDASDRETIIQSLHFYGVRENPQEWLTWIGEQEVKSKATERATSQILSGWTRENFVAAGEWIQNQADGPAKNTAVKTYAETLAPHEPAAAADWALTLPEGTERNVLLQTIHSSMKNKDPEAASAFAEKNGLTVEPAE